MGSDQEGSRAYRIEFTANAEKQFLSFSSKTRIRIAGIMDGLSADPRPRGAKKLLTSKDLYRVRSGHLRIIYQVREGVLVVLVVRIADRKEAYRNLQSLLKR